jgi:hypothetical protein
MAMMRVTADLQIGAAVAKGRNARWVHVLPMGYIIAYAWRLQRLQRFRSTHRSARATRSCANPSLSTHLQAAYIGLACPHTAGVTTLTTPRSVTNCGQHAMTATNPNDVDSLPTITTNNSLNPLVQHCTLRMQCNTSDTHCRIPPIS